MCPTLWNWTICALLPSASFVAKFERASYFTWLWHQNFTSICQQSVENKWDLKYIIYLYFSLLMLYFYITKTVETILLKAFPGTDLIHVVLNRISGSCGSLTKLALLMLWFDWLCLFQLDQSTCSSCSALSGLTRRTCKKTQPAFTGSLNL